MTQHCVYHSNDLDGLCSAAIVLHKYPDINLIPIDYGEPFPWDSAVERYDDVIMVDFSLEPWDQMLRLDTHCGRLVWIDHHKSAIESMEEQPLTNALCVTKVGVGACELVWNHLFPDIPLPLGVKLLGDYDVWNHEDPRVLPFQYGMRAATDSPTDDGWKDVLSGKKTVIGDTIVAGTVVLGYVYNTNAKLAKALSQVVGLEGLRFITANWGSPSSTFFDTVYDETKHDGMCAYFWKKDKWHIHLYTTNPQVDVGAIAKKNGGGGHQRAAGWQSSFLPFFSEETKKALRAAGCEIRTSEDQTKFEE